MSPDVVIVGGAVMGSAVAYHLVRRGGRVVVVERDPTYARSSTVLSDGNVRVQFNLPENIAMSVYALEVLAGFADEFAVGEWRPDPAARHQGNLFLVGPEGESAAREGLDRQRALGCEVEWWEASEVAVRCPPYAGEGYVAATFGPLDGSVDPSAVLHGYRRAASRLGAEYVAGEATEVLVTAGAVTGVGLADGTRIDAPTVVNAAGAWCSILAATAGVDLPVIPVARTVYTIETPHDGALPSVFPPSGPYLIPEGGGRFFAGWSRPDDPVGFEFGFSRARFDDVVWPALVAAFPAFEALRLVGGWSGLYEVNTLDGNAILGEWPELEGFYLANGFSGHGFQQCHAVGRHLAELILGLEPSLDLGRFGPERILAGEPYPEHAGRII